MSKRFTDSEKFNDLWYRKLKPKHKCLWEFMLAKCDICGMLELDFESMSFHIGEKFSIEDLNDFQDKIIFIEENKIFIPNFIKFQQNELNQNNPAHKNIIKKLENLGIDLSLDFKELQSTFEGASMPLSRDISKGNSNSNSNKEERSVLDSKNYAKKEYGEFKNVLLTDDEYQKLFNLYFDKLDEALECLSVWKKNKNKKSTHNYGSMLKTQWVYKKVMEEGGGQKSIPLTQAERNKKAILQGLGINEKGEKI